MEIRVLLPSIVLDRSSGSLFRRSAIKNPWLPTRTFHYLKIMRKNRKWRWIVRRSVESEPLDRILQRNCYASITGSCFIHNLVWAEETGPSWGFRNRAVFGFLVFPFPQVLSLEFGLVLCCRMGNAFLMFCVFRASDCLIKLLIPLSWWYRECCVVKKKMIFYISDLHISDWDVAFEFLFNLIV